MRFFVCALVLATLPLLAGCGSSSSPSAPSTSVGTFTETDLVVGTGAAAAAGQTVTVNYTLWLYDTSKTDGKGAQVQTTVGGVPFAFVLGVGQVIKGWDQGVVGMKVGGSRRLIIPPELAYGSAGQSGIPSNATLVFDISLLSVQ
ncbi:MAG TPA: FKBP-type peptidyl-prolyl cis-trans isomerase [Vicinamibacterales bacterium]|jgi:FKBP-type peptidyl-prolyl cis-trans isomerase|nr:FKBP-type peptidyl-prolyl cis-trans isomerase [Vicinamibacterales bacterium]